MGAPNTFMEVYMPLFTNQATLSFNNTVTNSNIVIGNLIEALNVTKNAIVDTYARGENIAYVVTVVNSGNVAYNDLTLVDDLGAYQFGTLTLVPLTYAEGSLHYYLDGVLQPDPVITVDGGITVSGINVPAGSSALFVYEAEANGFAPLGEGDSITNTVTVNGEAVTETVTASAVVTPLTEPILSISKAISPNTVSENGMITYTFVIQNVGNTATVETDDLIVTDTFDPILRNITVTYNDAVLTSGTDYTYVNGVFTTVNGVISVPAATYTQNEDGTWVIDPGVSVITVSGTV